MGHSLPEGVHRVECKTVSGGGLDILRGATTMFNRISGAVYSAKKQEAGGRIGSQSVTRTGRI